MNRRYLSSGWLTLALLPPAFAIGWWARGLNYDRDVFLAAEKIADDAGGFFVPELGQIQGGTRLYDRVQAMSPEAKAEMQRRIEYYTRVTPRFERKPLPPGSLDSFRSRIQNFAEDTEARGGDGAQSETPDR